MSTDAQTVALDLGIDDFMLVHTSQQRIVPYLDDGVDQWEVVMYTVYDSSPDTPVGTARITTIDSYCPDPVAALDELSADLFSVGKALFGEDGELRDDLREQMAMPYGRIVIVDEVTIDERLRGQGLGVFLTGMALRHLSDISGVFALFPGPLERDDTPYEVAVQQLAQAWSRLGFEHYRDGTWVLDPGTTTLRAALRAGYERLARWRWHCCFRLQPGQAESELVSVTAVHADTPADQPGPEDPALGNSRVLRAG
ncbi:hypothetical protein ACFYNO_32900 [Kitasatospora sp. NPDC006697]|uniref:hypothetical protein n=1 Tax=Kitasatospora sp. NPDC006697 TaxID=3364020 RepID=UPI0036A456C5